MEKDIIGHIKCTILFLVKVYMHVCPGAWCTGGMNMVPWELQRAHEITDAHILESKAMYRGLVLEQCLEVLAQCKDADPADPRWCKLRLDALDRVMKLLKLVEPLPAPAENSGDMADRERIVARIDAELGVLAARMRG